MTQALIEKENDPKLYCSVPKVITYYIYTNPHLNPYYQKILLAMIQKKMPSRLLSSPTALNTI